MVFLTTKLYYLQNSYLQQSQNSLKTKTHLQEKVDMMFSLDTKHQTRNIFESGSQSCCGGDPSLIFNIAPAL